MTQQSIDSIVMEIERSIDRIEAAMKTAKISQSAVNQNLQKKFEDLSVENEGLKASQEKMSQKIDSTVLRLQTLIGNT